jgi:hypothetical protein
VFDRRGAGEARLALCGAGVCVGATLAGGSTVDSWLPANSAADGDVDAHRIVAGKFGTSVGMTQAGGAVKWAPSANSQSSAAIVLVVAGNGVVAVERS